MHCMFQKCLINADFFSKDFLEQDTLYLKFHNASKIKTMKLYFTYIKVPSNHKFRNVYLNLSNFILYVIK